MRTRARSIGAEDCSPLPRVSALRSPSLAVQTCRARGAAANRREQRADWKGGDGTDGADGGGGSAGTDSGVGRDITAASGAFACAGAGYSYGDGGN
eukprot:4625501-Pleurochrysis_carterae.AAC.1